ncbi:hypothetical protein ACF0H5_013157 [Mactra antiquata]
MGSGGSKEKKVKADNDKNKQVKPKTERRRSIPKKPIQEESPRRDPPKGKRRPSDPTNRKSDQHIDIVPVVPYEAENLNLQDNWEIEKGIDETTPPRDISYPIPRPTKGIHDTNMFIPVDFNIMKNNLNETRLAHGTFEDVATKLTSDFGLEILKVRALTTWISCQKIRTRNYGNDTKPDTVMAYMKQMKDLKGTFAGLLTLLCRAINIPCVIIKGLYKSHCHQVGEDDVKESKCTWNAVHVDGSWQIVHPFLICTQLSISTVQDGWKQVESTVETADQRMGSILNTFFFAPDPNEFLYFCIPDDSYCLWQLVEQKQRYATFLQTPFLRPAFFSTKLQLKNVTKGTMISDDGRCHIEIRCTNENINDMVFMYELYSNDPDFPELGEDYGDTVLCGRHEDTYHVLIKFPVEGTFKLSLYAKLNDWFFWVGDFKIICNVPLANYVRTPSVPKEVGYGPSTISEEAGLLAPSHEGGIIFFKPEEEHVIKFLVTEKMQYSHAVEHTGIESEDLHDNCKVIRRKSEVDFIVTIPSPGEYALRIYKVDDQGEDHNICNYLFIESYKRENLFQRKARNKLREATAGHDIESLQNAIKKSEDVKLPHDADYQRAGRRLQYLKIKRGLRDGRMRRHEGTLAKAVDDAENSRFKKAVEPSTNKARRILEDIQSLEMHCHPVSEMDQKTIAEIANFANPPRDVHDTMIATYMLLGEDKHYLQKWGNIQALLRRPGKQGIKNQVNEFRDKPMPDKHIIKQVQDIYDNVPKQYILSASLSAAAFYDWVGNVLGYVNNRSQNAADHDDSLDEITIDDMTYSSNNSIVYEEDKGNISQDEGFLDSQDP